MIVFNKFEKGGKSMNKGDLVNEVAKVVSTKKEAKAAVDCVFSYHHQGFEKEGYGYTGGLWNL